MKNLTARPLLSWKMGYVVGLKDVRLGDGCQEYESPSGFTTSPKFKVEVKMMGFVTEKRRVTVYMIT